MLAYRKHQKTQSLFGGSLASKLAYKIYDVVNKDQGKGWFRCSNNGEIYAIHKASLLNNINTKP
jgi:hypothetical protein